VKIKPLPNHSLRMNDVISNQAYTRFLAHESDVCRLSECYYDSIRFRCKPLEGTRHHTCTIPSETGSHGLEPLGSVRLVLSSIAFKILRESHLYRRTCITTSICCSR
jgi:hypothetical protein